MKIFVTGATGFTGSHVVPLLLQSGHEVRCLYRPSSDRSLLSDSKIEWALGDVSDSQSLTSAIQGTDTLVNIASLGFGNAENIIVSAKAAGIKRAIFISTTAIFTQLNASSKKVRVAAEIAIESSGLNYTILRPTMIYGSDRDRNMWRLLGLLKISPIVPIFGDGNHLQQPIFVDDVAQAVVSCLSNEKTIGKSYNIAGKAPLTYNEVIDTIAKQMHKRIWKIYIPSKPVVALLNFFEKIRVPFPIKAEQVLRLNENKNFSYAEAEKDFEFSPRSFEEGIGLELSVLTT